MIIRKRLNRLLMILAALLVAVSVAACGPGDDDTPEDAGPVDPNATMDTTTMDEPVDEPLNEGMTEEPLDEEMATEEPPMEPTALPTATPIPEMTEETMEPTVEPTIEATAEMTATEEAMTMDETASVMRADDIIGWNIHNAADEEIAEIDEVLFDENGDIQYVILNVDDTMDSPYYAVGWDTFAVSLGESATPDAVLYEGDPLNELSDAFGMNDAMLNTEDIFYEMATDAGADAQMLDGLYQLSAFANFELFDYDLVNPETDDDLGEIEELLVNVDEGTISYAIADIGGFLGIAETAVTIPWERIDFNADEENFTINADEDTLSNAPTLDLNEMDEWEVSTDWEQELETYWNSITN